MRVRERERARTKELRNGNGEDKPLLRKDGEKSSAIRIWKAGNYR